MLVLDLALIIVALCCWLLPVALGGLLRARQMSSTLRRRGESAQVETHWRFFFFFLKKGVFVTTTTHGTLRNASRRDALIGLVDDYLINIPVGTRGQRKGHRRPGVT
jgi:hypothetical protein